MVATMYFDKYDAIILKEEYLYLYCFQSILEFNASLMDQKHKKANI